MKNIRTESQPKISSNGSSNRIISSQANTSHKELSRADSTAKTQHNLKSYISELKKVSTQNKKTRGQPSNQTSNGVEALRQQ